MAQLHVLPMQMTSDLRDSDVVTEQLPEKRQLPLKGLYLAEDLTGLSTKRQKTLVLTTYLTDKNGVIAKADHPGHFQVPPETRNASDWRLSQELMAQANMLIIGGDYLRRVMKAGSHPQDILYQFEPEGEFAELGAWRLGAGYGSRSPDLAIVTRHLDFKIPERMLRSRRRTVVFTTDAVANSDQAKAMADAGTVVLGAGPKGVDGNEMVNYLSDEMDARVVMMTTGPGVLQLLLMAKRLDLLYLTRVEREIRADDPSALKRLLPDGKRVEDLTEFRLTHEYTQDRVVAADGSLVSQLLLRYDRRDLSHA